MHQTLFSRTNARNALAGVDEAGRSEVRLKSNSDGRAGGVVVMNRSALVDEIVLRPPQVRVAAVLMLLVMSIVIICVCFQNLLITWCVSRHASTAALVVSSSETQRANHTV